MSAGWVLVQTRKGEAARVAAALKLLGGVESVDQTAGAYDVVARVGAGDSGVPVPSARRVAQAALRVPGVTLAVCCGEGQTKTIRLPEAEAPIVSLA